MSFTWTAFQSDRGRCFSVIVDDRGAQMIFGEITQARPADIPSDRRQGAISKAGSSAARRSNSSSGGQYK
jgi:hypothetical protein